MLHPVKPPRCAGAMMQIVEFQYNVLDLACNPATVLPVVDSPSLRRQFGSATDWLIGLLSRDSEFSRAFEGLFNYMRANPTHVRDALLSFNHDVTFHEHLDDPSFTFSYRSLPQDTREKIKVLLVTFYENLMQNGIPPEVHGGAGSISKRSFRDDFWNENKELGLCPACDGQKPDLNKGSVKSQNDHILYKADYPCLSVHPSNLLPICTDCNGIKLAKDLIDDQAIEPLLNFFHPYSRPASPEIKVTIESKKTGELRVRIRDNAGASTRSVKSLNRVLNLEERWSGRIKEPERVLIESLKAHMRKIKQTGIERTTLESQIEDSTISIPSLIGKSAGHYLNSFYKEYILADADALEALRVQVERKL